MFRKHMNQTADKMACSATRRGPNSTAFTKRTSSTKVCLRNVWYVYTACHTCAQQWPVTCNELQSAAIDCELWTTLKRFLVSAWWVLKGSEGSFEGSFLPSCVTSPTNGPILPLELPSAVPGWHWLEMGPTPRHQPNNVVDPINDSQLICCWVHYLGWCKMTPNWLANGANGIVCLIRWKKMQRTCKQEFKQNLE